MATAKTAMTRQATSFDVERESWMAKLTLDDEARDALREVGIGVIVGVRISVGIGVGIRVRVEVLEGIEEGIRVEVTIGAEPILLYHRSPLYIPTHKIPPPPPCCNIYPCRWEN